MKTFVAGIHGATVASGVGVIGRADRSARDPCLLGPVQGSDQADGQGERASPFALKPVTFRYKEELDPDHVPQFGLIAEEVEKVNPDLVVRDENGKVDAVRYEAVNAMLLNEFLKAHRKLEEQGATIAQQQKQIESLAAGLQKVSAQIESSKPAPQTDLNQAEDFSPAGFFASSRPAIPENQLSGEEKGEPMKLSIQMNKAISLFLVFLSALVCFGLTPTVQAVSPAPDGGYPRTRTRLKEITRCCDLTSGQNNTAIGFSALSEQHRWRSANTAIGASALLSNISGDFNTATGCGRARFQHHGLLQHGNR